MTEAKKKPLKKPAVKKLSPKKPAAKKILVKKTEKLKSGPPSKFTEKMGERICEIIATHDIGTQTLCETNPDMPPYTTLNQWRYRNPDFNEQFRAAKMFQADLLADSLDNVANEKMYYFDSDGNKRVETGFTNDKRLRIDTRKWIAAKLLPKTYGDKVEIQNTKDENESMKKELQNLRKQLQEQNESEY